MLKIDALKKKIKYRSEYRGIKEMDLILGNFVKKYIDSFSYDELKDLYNILEKDDDTILKWYSNLSKSNAIPENNVSKLLKNLNYNNGGEGGIEPTNE